MSNTIVTFGEIMGRLAPPGFFVSDRRFPDLWT